jgi:hypothetical protein
MHRTLTQPSERQPAGKGAVVGVFANDGPGVQNPTNIVHRYATLSHPFERMTPKDQPLRH